MNLVKGDKVEISEKALEKVVEQAKLDSVRISRIGTVVMSTTQYTQVELETDKPGYFEFATVPMEEITKLPSKEANLMNGCC